MAGNYVGMPQALLLDVFAKQVYFAFGDYPCLVGSATKSKEWRDVDVRLIITDKLWDILELGSPFNPGLRWTSACMAYSALGKEMTGLPIDFQIQQQSWALKKYGAEPQLYLGVG